MTKKTSGHEQGIIPHAQIHDDFVSIKDDKQTTK